MEKETLEEAAHKMLVDYGIKSIGQSIGVLTVKKLMVNMAKWQQKRSYSEADKIMKFLDTEVDLKLSDIKTIERIKWYFETYFEQFKKK